VKLFYTGPFANAEMLVVMLDKHGITATQSFVEVTLPDDGDLAAQPKCSCQKPTTTAPSNCSTPNAKMNFEKMF
jgi:hypothetical protein